jgi:hypothetical protein
MAKRDGIVVRVFLWKTIEGGNRRRRRSSPESAAHLRSMVLCTILLDMSPALLEFIYTRTFESTAAGLLGERDLRAMEQSILAQPETGDVIVGAGGARKMRVAVTGRGKRGGARVIYYYHSAKGRVYLLFVYAKHDADDLSDDGKRQMRAYVRLLEAES